MSIRVERTFCRICSASCGMIVSIDENNKIVKIVGDKAHPMTNGYTCFKGLQAPEHHHGPQRLLKPLKRRPDGGFETISSEQAIAEIAERLDAILAKNGPRSLAFYNGTQGHLISTYQFNEAFLRALGSDQLYSNLTIDQSAKIIAFERMGAWMAGLQDMAHSEVVMFVGANPLISHNTVPVMGPDPLKRLKSAKKRGMKLICIDPRRTETAQYADLILQPLPGQDPAVLAGMLRYILQMNWHDAEFCHRFVAEHGLQQLRNAVEPFTLEMVEKRAALQPGQIAAAAQMFAKDNHTGAAYASTGPSMAPFSNIMQHLLEALNIVCGRFRRPGDRVIVDMIAPAYPIYAEVVPPPRSYDKVPPSRIRGVGNLMGQRLTGTLADEVLTPGEGQIHCLFVSGGNPASAVPDQRRMVEAIRSLDLVVTIDPYMNNTAKLSHYVLPPVMEFERADLPISVPGFPLYPENWAQYAQPILSAPEGSDLVADWYPLWAIAKRLKRQIIYNNVAIDMESAPTTESLLEMRLAGSRVTLEELKQYLGGKVYDVPDAVVQPTRPESTAKFDVMPQDAAEELANFLSASSKTETTSINGRPATHLLSTRRTRDVWNTNGLKLSSILRRTPFNPAYLNHEDLQDLHLNPGDKVRITSEHGSIEAIVDIDEGVRSGVVSMAHCWGSLPDEKDEPGASTNLLISCHEYYEPINAMPRMSAVPVRIDIVH